MTGPRAAADLPRGPEGAPEPSGKPPEVPRGSGDSGGGSGPGTPLRSPAKAPGVRGDPPEGEEAAGAAGLEMEMEMDELNANPCMPPSGLPRPTVDGLNVIRSQQASLLLLIIPYIIKHQSTRRIPEVNRALVEYFFCWNRSLPVCPRALWFVIRPHPGTSSGPLPPSYLRAIDHLCAQTPPTPAAGMPPWMGEILRRLGAGPSFRPRAPTPTDLRRRQAGPWRRDEATHLNVRLFLVKLVLNRPAVFQPFGGPFLVPRTAARSPQPNLGNASAGLNEFEGALLWSKIPTINSHYHPHVVFARAHVLATK